MKMNRLKNEIKQICHDERTPVDEIFRGAKTTEDVLKKIQYLEERASNLKQQYGVPGYPLLTILDFKRIEKILMENQQTKKKVA